jgi:hypothetical protein
MIKYRRGYSHLKEEALDRTMWRNRFGGGLGPVVRQNTEWMNELIYTGWRGADWHISNGHRLKCVSRLRATRYIKENMFIIYIYIVHFLHLLIFVLMYDSYTWTSFNFSFKLHLRSVYFLFVQCLTYWISDSCIKSMRSCHIIKQSERWLLLRTVLVNKKTWQISTNIHFGRQGTSRFPDSQVYYLHFYWFLYVIWKQSLFRKSLYCSNRRF